MATLIFILDLVFAIILLVVILILISIIIEVPKVHSLEPLKLKRDQLGDNHFAIGNNWIKKNEHGIWEVYIEGDPFERGVIYGKLCEELIQDQENMFVSQVESIIPSELKRGFLKIFVGFFNRKLAKYIPEEFRHEIYGVSFSFSDQHDTIGPKFYRILNYHAAHDIGHALEELNMVGCTSFAVNNSDSQDGELLVGRNFDFYMGDDFARDKVLTMVRPTDGIPLVMYSWAGLMGVVSGMNLEGLTITLNASKSTIPTVAKEPISVLAREILQFATTIDEAIEIAKKREVFVSESLLIASSKDDRAVIIEKSPSGFDVYESQNDTTICSNHYQSDHFKNTEINLENIEMSDSNYRFQRMSQLVKESIPIDLNKAIGILRNKEGVDNTDISLGNPKAINQLIAHHGTVMKPKEKKVWFSTAPFQLGKFVGYDLNNIFRNSHTKPEDLKNNLLVDEDPFAQTHEFQVYERYRAIKKVILDAISYKSDFKLSEELIAEYIASNPNSYIVYMTLGEFFIYKKNKQKAKYYLDLALTKELASKEEGEKIKTLLKQCK